MKKLVKIGLTLGLVVAAGVGIYAINILNVGEDCDIDTIPKSRRQDLVDVRFQIDKRTGSVVAFDIVPEEPDLYVLLADGGRYTLKEWCGLFDERDYIVTVRDGTATMDDGCGKGTNTILLESPAGFGDVQDFAVVMESKKAVFVFRMDSGVHAVTVHQP